MIWFWPAFRGRDNCLPLVNAIKILLRSVLSAAMGCFLSCFRLGDCDDLPTADRSRYQLVSQPEAAVTCNWNQFSSLFVSDEKEDQYDLEAMGKEKQDIRIPGHVLDIAGLMDQAKFLKACGTLPETPVEIQKFSKECGDSSGQKGVLEPLDLNSCLPDSSIVNQNLVSHPDQPLTPSKKCDESMEGSVSAAFTPISCMNGEKSIGPCSVNGSAFRSTPSIAINVNQAHSYIDPSVTPAILPSSTRINKSVRFKVEPYPSDSEKAFSSKVAGLKSLLSPYPTPLRLTDDMQTPGTIFPAYANNMANGKAPQVRYQYVVSTLNRVEKVSHLKELMDEHSTSIQGSIEQPKETDFNSEIDRETTSKNESSVHLGGTPGDRPIHGVIAAHWYDDDTSHISPKWWGGNGIPNTTTKYKEDQKVSWHATPFEERLEKALCDETFVLRRKLISDTPTISFKENEGS